MPELPWADVPTIDMSPLFGVNAEAKKAVGEQIDRACRGSGFFLAKKHGLEHLLPEFLEVTRRFHQTITDEERTKLAIAAYNKENVKQIRNGYYLPVKGKKAVESFCYINPAFHPEHPLVKNNTPFSEVNVWPDEKKHPGLREFQEMYFWKSFEFSTILLRGFALALGKPEKFFDDVFRKDDTISAVRLIRYPYLDDYPPVKTAPDGTQISFDNHVDVSMLTVLYQPFVANLQVETPTGFQNIPSSDDCYLVNVGGYMEHITKGYYKAPIHRVKYVNAERLSLPFFVMFGYHSLVEPFTPNGAEEDKTKEYKPWTYGGFFEKARLDLIVKNGQT